MAERYPEPTICCPHCHRGTCPLDEELGLRPNGMSAELERLAGMVGVQMAFGKGSHVFAELTLISLSDQALDKAAQAYGQEIEQIEGEWQVEAQDREALLRRQREASSPPLRLYGALDGTMVHTRGEKEHPLAGVEDRFLVRGPRTTAKAARW